ncbi:hypothetical protein BH11PSE7_BH11PSE7_16060 [soil metagenome]
MPRTRHPAPDLQRVPSSMTRLPTFSDELRKHLESISDIQASYQVLASRVAIDPAGGINPLQSAPMQVAAFMRILNSSMSMHMRLMEELLVTRQRDWESSGFSDLSEGS